MQTFSKITLALAFTLCASAYAQGHSQDPDRRVENISTYRINVVSRTTPAVNYKHRSGSTKIDFTGTNLMPSANGEAKVDSHRGAMEIKVEFADLQPPTAFGGEYLTYVMWAISPEGRQVNLGEVLVGGNHRSKLDVTTDLQAFALIVTAEPYYAVRRPSNVVILENSIRSDTRGTSEAVDAKYELIDRGGYIPTGYTFDPVVVNTNLPMEFFEARNAVRIAQSAGADKYAAESYEKAVHQMKEADELAITKHENRKSLIAISRETVQTAEDAREIAMKHRESERAEHERSASATREANANANASHESELRASAEADSAHARHEREEADRKNADAQAAALQAKNAQATAEADSDRNRAAVAASDQQLEQAKSAQATAEADSDRNRAAAASSDKQLQQSILEREELRARLLKQFNLILETRDTARGLVVNMSDVLFDSGQFTLRPLAREKLAKISGIVLAYPTLMLAVEGNTDSVGTEEFNQTLSERRADGVRSYLTKQGVPETSTTSMGFGKSRPIASNDTSEGRQQNRRVELVVSGEIIGTKIVAISMAPAADSTSPRK